MLKKQIQLVKEEQNRQDVGFGTKIIGDSTRLVNRDGKFNIKHIGQPFRAWLNLYNRLIVMSWTRFALMIFAMFFLANCIFALLYLLIGLEHLNGILGETPFERFSDAFFFSAQTLTTVGYGRISPVGFWASLVSAIESLSGLLSFALATGLLYGKFSRPIAHIRYANNALIAPYLSGKAFMFRIINERNHQLIEVSVEVVLSRLELNHDGSKIRKYFGLSLERNKVNFFPSNWTIVHAITEESPLYGLSETDLAVTETEILILVKGFDDSFAQTVHSRNSYLFNEIVWGGKYEGMQQDEGHITKVDLRKLSNFQKVEIS